ncbi:FAD dependent oxidoreductase [Periconia macrospinosa]|uniref:FAD dependent oxidoreductase n=1 Tax=Periconia macrospinosa TaxID=97972 RepID=A0A2V1DVR1_9PLEO|nr:FAD dependent oxidoreductase [Periconia macrospinosa]
MEERSHIPVNPPIPNPLPSYWQTPPSPLANILSPPSAHNDLEEPYDYAIIGSGISGAMTAYNLLFNPPKQPTTTTSPSPPPPRVIMLEARTLCSGATGRNGGHTKAASYRTYLHHKSTHGKSEALKIARLEYDNIRATHKLAQELGIECDNQRCNTVDLIYDRETFEAGKKAIRELRADADEEERALGGMAWYRIYDPSPSDHDEDGMTPLSAITQKFYVKERNTNPSPLIPAPDSSEGEGRRRRGEKLVGAIEYTAGRINAYAFTTSILSMCVTQKKLKILTNTPVLSISSSSSPSSSPTLLHTLQTPTNPTSPTITTKTLILATNAYTASLLPSPFQTHIVPLRGQITAQQFSTRHNSPHPSVLPRTYSFIYKNGYEYMISRNEPSDGTQHIIIGGGLGRLPEMAGEFGGVDDGALNADVSAYLRGVLGGYFGFSKNDDDDDNDENGLDGEEGLVGGDDGELEEQQQQYQVLNEWTGIMGATTDGLPFVGEVPGRRGVWVLAGFNGHGMVLCLKCAEAVVGMVRAGGGEGEEEVETVREWFPRCFGVTRERVEGAVFKGRVDMDGGVGSGDMAGKGGGGGCGVVV